MFVEDSDGGRERKKNKWKKQEMNITRVDDQQDKI